MTSYTLRVDEATKAGAAAVAEYYGFDLASVTRAFYKQMIRTHAIPLTFESEEPNDESLEAIHDAERLFASGEAGRFSSADEMLAALGI